MDSGMTMMMDVPGWLTALAWAWVAACAISVAVLSRAVLAHGRGRATTPDVVWPLSALYLGPIAVWLHARWSRPRETPPMIAGGLAGGVASALAHLVGVPLVVLLGLRIAGIDLWPMILVIAVIAIALLAAFEALGGRALGAAVALAAVTVLAFDIGMGGWMLLLHFTGNMPPATHVAFWFLMQVGVVLGTLTALPVLAGRVAIRRPAAGA